MKIASFFSVMILLTAFAPGDAPPVKDYLQVPGPLTFNLQTYQLHWSAHPNASYYKQEYLPAGQTSEKYTRMVMLEVATGEFVLADLVKAKTTELEQRKKTDPTCNYAVIQHPQTGEYLLDFVVSQGSGASTITEWNAYRYVKLTANAGAKGVLLMAFSKRAYGDAGTAFLQQLKMTRAADIKSLAAYKVPEVKL